MAKKNEGFLRQGSIVKLKNGESVTFDKYTPDGEHFYPICDLINNPYPKPIPIAEIDSIT